MSIETAEGAVELVRKALPDLPGEGDAGGASAALKGYADVLSLYDRGDRAGALTLLARHDAAVERDYGPKSALLTANQRARVKALAREPGPDRLQPQQETPTMMCVLFSHDESVVIHRQDPRGKASFEAERVTVSEPRLLEGCERTLTISFLRKGRRTEEHATFASGGPTIYKINTGRQVAYDTREPDSVYLPPARGGTNNDTHKERREVQQNGSKESKIMRVEHLPAPEAPPLAGRFVGLADGLTAFVPRPQAGAEEASEIDVIEGTTRPRTGGSRRRSLSRW